MPHLTLEYTANLHDFDPAKALAALNHAALASGQFDEADIKSRAIRLDTYRIGTSTAPRAFIHVRVALLSGRTPEVRKHLAQSLLAALTTAVDLPKTGEIQLSVETTDIDRASYAKEIVYAG